jgi:hypothetical protein
LAGIVGCACNLLFLTNKKGQRKPNFTYFPYFYVAFCFKPASMMSKLLFQFVLVILSFKSFGQFEIERNDFAREGQNFIYNISEFKPSDKLRLKDLSRDMVDFTPYRSLDYDTIEFVNPDSTNFGENFTKANLAIYSSKRNVLYLYDDNSAIREVGNVGDYLEVQAEVIIVFEDRFTFMKFPMELHSKYKDSTFKDIRIPYHYYNFQDSVRKDMKVWAESEVDTVCTIVTPYGRYKTLREKITIRRQIDGYEFSPHGGWIPASKYRERSRRVIYRWYAKGEGLPIAEVWENAQGFITKIKYQVNDPMVIKLIPVDLKCKGQNDGMVMAGVTGGIPYYDFEWDNGAKTQNITGLKNGTYTVTVTDNRKQTKSATVTIYEPQVALHVNLDATQITCYGARNGSIKANVITGHPPYKYQWSNFRKDSVLTNISPGRYWLTVVDSMMCKSSDTVDITQPDKLDIKLIPIKLKCKGRPEGEIKTEITGGTPDYQIVWADGSTQINRNHLAAGKYSAQVSDKNGCKDSAKVIIMEPARPFEYKLSVNHINCNGLQQGSVYVQPKGGYQPYKIMWSTGDSISKLDSLCPGLYTFTLQDANECTFTDTANILEPEKQLQMKLFSKNETSLGGDGEILICADGGSLPYKFDKWPFKEKNFQHVKKLKSGIYKLTLTDANGCTVNDSVEVKADIVKPFFVHNCAEAFPFSRNFADKEGFVYLDQPAISKIIAYNIWGDLVADEEIINGELPSRLYKLPEGLYLYYIIGKNGKAQMKAKFSSL